MLQWVVDHEAALAAGGLFVISEVMSFVPSLKSNGIVQFVINVLKKMDGSAEAAPAPKA